MKRFLILAASVGVLAACGADGSSSVLGGGMSTGSTMVKMVVDNQCRSDLQSRPAWRAAALAMSQAQQNAWEDKICSCVSEEATTNMTVNDAAQIINPATRNAVVASVTAKTVTACVNRLYTK